MMTRGRTVGELIILMLAGTVCVSVVLTGTGLVLLAVLAPERDTTKLIAGFTSVISSLLALIAGFLAGRSDRGRRNGDQ